MAQFAVPYIMYSESREKAQVIELIVTEKNIYSIEQFVQQNRLEHPDQEILLNFRYSREEIDDHYLLLFDIIQKIFDSDIIISIDLYFFERAVEAKENGWRILPPFTCNNWDTYYRLINQKFITDIRIGGELLFELPDVRACASRRVIKIWACCNEVPRSYTIEKPSELYLDGFIRPEDVQLYSEYIDVFELSPFVDDKEGLDTLYRIYAEDKKWKGDLQLIIKGIFTKIDGGTLMKQQWSKYRVDCRRNCMKGHSCRICPNQLVIAKTMQEEGFTFSDKEE